MCDLGFRFPHRYFTLLFAPSQNCSFPCLCGVWGELLGALFVEVASSFHLGTLQILDLGRFEEVFGRFLVISIGFHGGFLVKFGFGGSNFCFSNIEGELERVFVFFIELVELVGDVSLF